MRDIYKHFRKIMSAAMIEVFVGLILVRESNFPRLQGTSDASCLSIRSRLSQTPQMIGTGCWYMSRPTSAFAGRRSRP